MKIKAGLYFYKGYIIEKSVGATTPGETAWFVFRGNSAGDVYGRYLSFESSLANAKRYVDDRTH